MERTRFLESRPFPEYQFLPGKNTHPLKEGGHMYKQDEPTPPELNPELPFENEDYLFSIDLLNFEYFWEAHVYLEAIWNKHERIGEIALLCKALIKIAAAGVKFKIGQDSAARGHLDRALELLNELDKDEFSGLDLIALKKGLIKVAESNELPFEFIPIR